MARIIDAKALANKQGRATNALERSNERFRRSTITQVSLPDSPAVLLMLFDLLRSGQVRLTTIDACDAMDLAA